MQPATDRADDVVATDRSREARWQGVFPTRAAGLLPVAFRSRNRRHETIATFRDSGYVAGAGPTITERLPQRSDLCPEIALVDDGVGPGARNQLVLADELTRAVDQGDQDVERATADTKRLVGLKQQLPCGHHAKRPERDGVVSQVSRPDRRRTAIAR